MVSLRVLIRTDASVSIGSGHLMRCLTLSNQLRNEGAEVAFVCRDVPGAMFEMLQSFNYRFIKLPISLTDKPSQRLDARETIKAARKLFPDGIDWLIVDHYELNIVWERMLRSHTSKIMVIDDLANRMHDCDLLLDQNYYLDQNQRYQGLVPDKCIKLLGPKYVLLRPEFNEARKKLRPRNGTVRKILIFFGGSDFTNQTSKALDAIKIIGRQEIAVDVVVGSGNPFQNKLQILCYEMPNVKYHCQVSNMAQLISAADIAIGAGGATSWERCLLGLPTLTVVFAYNQLQTTLDLEKIGATEFLGWADDITAYDLARAIDQLINDPNRLNNLSERATHILQEWQGAEAVTSVMKI